jgi:ribonuclease P protein component
MDAAKEHRFRLGRRFSLGRNKHFQYVYRRGKSTPARLLVLVYLKARDVKVGFSVSAKVGNSVVRNRIRRYLREDFRMQRPNLPGGKYIFVARTIAARATHQELTREMAHLLRKAGLTQ